MRTLHTLAQHPHKVSPRIKLPVRMIYGSYQCINAKRDPKSTLLRNPDFVQNLDGQGEDAHSFDAELLVIWEQ